MAKSTHLYFKAVIDDSGKVNSFEEIALPKVVEELEAIYTLGMGVRKNCVEAELSIHGAGKVSRRITEQVWFNTWKKDGTRLVWMNGDKNTYYFSMYVTLPDLQ